MVFHPCISMPSAMFQCPPILRSLQGFEHSGLSMKMVSSNILFLFFNVLSFFFHGCTIILKTTFSYIVQEKNVNVL